MAPITDCHQDHAVFKAHTKSETPFMFVAPTSILRLYFGDLNQLTQTHGETLKAILRDVMGEEKIYFSLFFIMYIYVITLVVTAL